MEPGLLVGRRGIMTCAPTTQQSRREARGEAGLGAVAIGLERSEWDLETESTGVASIRNGGYHSLVWGHRTALQARMNPPSLIGFLPHMGCRLCLKVLKTSSFLIN